MKNLKEVVLEQSTNTHKFLAQEVVSKDLGNGIIQLDVNNANGIVTHGEHGTLRTETKRVFKYVQQELNPVTKKMQSAWD
jgi:hypothetical protein